MDEENFVVGYNNGEVVVEAKDVSVKIDRSRIVHVRKGLTGNYKSIGMRVEPRLTRAEKLVWLLNYRASLLNSAPVEEAVGDRDVDIEINEVQDDGY